MADVAATLAGWSSTSNSNSPSGTTNISTGLDDNLRELQGVVVRGLSHKGADIASVATTDIGAVEGLFHDITGITTITSFGTVRAGIWKILKFEGALTLTHNAISLILLGAENRTTASGDTGIYISEGSGNWREIAYFPVAINPGKAVSTDETQTLANKTLTTPIIAGTGQIGWAGLASFSVAGDIGTGNPGVNFDNNDFIDYNRTTNTWRVVIGGAELLKSVAGAVTIGGAATDAHTLNGTLHINDGASVASDTLALTCTGANGLNIRLAGDGAVTPNKFIRVIAGELQVLNSAYGALILQLSDAGLLTVPSLSVTGNTTLGDAASDTLTINAKVAGPVQIGDTANANNTAGLTINQGADNNHALTLKSSAVTTGLTTLPIGPLDVETDDYFAVGKVSPLIGGAVLYGLAESTNAIPFIIEAWGGAPETTDTSASNAAMLFRAGQHNGANAAVDMAANSNLAAWAEIDSGGIGLTRMLLKADDGELHLGNTTLVALDAEDDVQLVRAMQKESASDGILLTEYDNPFYDYQKLREVGLAGEKDDSGFFLFPLQPRLHAHEGAIWQLFTKLQEQAKEIAELKRKLLPDAGPFITDDEAK